MEYRDGRIYRFAYTNTHPPKPAGDADSCSMQCFRGGRESGWEDKGNVTTAPHLVGKGGEAGRAVLEDQPETIKIKFTNLDPQYYCGAGGTLPDELALNKKSKQCNVVKSPEYNKKH